jgi:hypothetical protein
VRGPEVRSGPCARGREGVSFRFSKSLIRERADPKGATGGWGCRIRPRKAARSSACKSGRDYAGPHADLDAALGASTEPLRQAKRSPAQAVEADRVWKAPDPRPTASGPSHTRWKSRPPIRHPGFPQLHTASATKADGKGREEKNRHECALIYSRWGTTTPPDHPRELDRPWDNNPTATPSSSTLRAGRQAPHHALTQTPPRSITRSSWTATSPHPADANAPALRSSLVWTATTNPPDHPLKLHPQSWTATSPTKSLTHKPPRSINPSSWTAPSPRAAGRKRLRSPLISRVDGDDQPTRPPAQAPPSILDGNPSPASSRAAPELLVRPPNHPSNSGFAPSVVTSPFPRRSAPRRALRRTAPTSLRSASTPTAPLDLQGRVSAPELRPASRPPSLRRAHPISRPPI